MEPVRMYKPGREGASIKAEERRDIVEEKYKDLQTDTRKPHRDAC